MASQRPGDAVTSSCFSASVVAGSTGTPAGDTLIALHAIDHNQFQKDNLMNKSAKTEIVIPTWAGRTGPGFWGDRDYSYYDNQSSSFWVSLRGVLPGDRHSYMNDDCREAGDIGL